VANLVLCGIALVPDNGPLWTKTCRNDVWQWNTYI